MTINPIRNLLKRPIRPKIYLDLPENPGVYIYFQNGIPIYVGKANNLKRRVSSYFRLQLETKTAKMMAEAEEIAYIKVENELEALLLEARLIRDFQPKYNIISKDDKHPLYIVITDEEYPRVLTIRKPVIKQMRLKSVFGPFPSTTSVKTVLKTVRRIFPYSDHKIGKKPCLYYQLGLCNPCPNIIEGIKDLNLKKAEKLRYLKNINNLKSFLEGKTSLVKNKLEKEMREASEGEMYEDAALIRNKLSRLEYITRPGNAVELYLENPNLYEDIREKEISDLGKIVNKFIPVTVKLNRIECFDVAHIQGSDTAASMVTFLNGVPEKNYYRHFKIRQVHGQDDYESMRELAKRRKKNLTSLGRPDLIIVDGGKGQVSVFLREFEEEGIPVVGLAKKYETLVVPVTEFGTKVMKEYKLPAGPALNLVQRIRNEAHRFAQAYHHKLFEKSLIEVSQPSKLKE